jgi:hypothetical protein
LRPEILLIKTGSKHRVAVRKKRFLNGLFRKMAVHVAGSFVLLTEIISGQFTAKAQMGL